jgi:hypothetical protein
LEGGGAQVSILIFIFLSLYAQASHVRDLPLRPKDVGVVNTAVGYSTVIQLNSKPLNVVLGDQSSFRVEYINDSVTIKPVRSAAKSNLFIFTENDRFSLTVRSGPSSLVDYIVHLRRIFEDPKQAKVIKMGVKVKGVTLTLIRSVYSAPNVYLDFVLESSQPKTIRPEDLRILFGKSVVPIRTLYLEHIHLKPSQPVQGAVSYVSAQNRVPTMIWLGFNQEKPLKFSFPNGSKQGVKIDAL